MERNLVRFLLVVILFLLIVAGSLTFWRFSARAYYGLPGSYVALGGQMVPLIQKAQVLQDAPSNQSLALLISLQPRNSAALDNLLQALYDPGSTSYHQPYTAFTDIASGDNLYYPATSTYDLASGLGTPDLYNMARDLA